MSITQYTMRHVDVTVPLVMNDGRASGYGGQFEEAVRMLGFNGWTRTEGTGSWHGAREPVAVYTFYLPTDAANRAIASLNRLGRAVMYDQEAVQLVDHGDVTLWEA